MGSESPAPLAEVVDVVVDASVDRSCPTKKNKSIVPKRIHKAEREKLKRERLNELFIDLANALELDQKNSGKACVLNEATRLLKDLFSRIESLKKENASLLSESHYVTIEKYELKEETSTLESQIETLQSELEAWVANSKPNLNAPPHEFQQPELTSYFPGDSYRLPAAVEPTSPQAPAVLVVHIHSDLQAYSTPEATQVSKATSKSNVRKPHARYPNPATDAWPSQLLGGCISSTRENGPRNMPVVSLVYPLYASVRAIETKSPADDRQWLTYWILYSMITLIELTFAKVIEWIPIWSYAKLIFTCWLVIPYFSGAAYVYEHYLRPFFLNPQTINIWYVPRKKDVSSRPDDILTAAEKYMEKNGTDAFEKLIHRADKSRRNNNYPMYEYDNAY